MRTIIPGGSGLIGRALAASLAADKHEVIILSRDPQHRYLRLAGVRLEQWDGRTAAGWGHWADGADAIVNLAGENFAGESLLPIFLKRWSAKRKRTILESRINAGQAVVQAIEAAKKKPGVLIQSSAVGYYGIVNQDALTEDAPRANDFLARVCFD